MHRSGRPSDMRKPAILCILLTLVPVVAVAQEIESLAGVRLVFDHASARSLATGSTGMASRQGDAAAVHRCAELRAMLGEIIESAGSICLTSDAAPNVPSLESL